MKIKNFPFKLIKKIAVTEKSNFSHSFLTFDNKPIRFYEELLETALITKKDYEKSGTKDIVLLEDYVIKSEKRSLFKRLSLIYGQRQDKHGHCGVSGEAINTLTANQNSLDAHKVAAIYINFFTGEFHLIFKRIKTKVALAQLVDDLNKQELNCTLINIIHNISQHCKTPILHPECHSEHIFCNHNGTKIQLIDYERAIKSSCSSDQLAAITLMRIIGDPKIYSLINFQEFLDLVRKSHTNSSSFNQIEKVIACMQELNDISQKKQRGRGLYKWAKPKGAISDLI